MGVQLSKLISKQTIDLDFLNGKKVAIDAYNMIYQFLSTIRQHDTGQLLMDSKGNVTSHLSGLFYRNINFLEQNIKPIYVFDGTPPEFKRKTIEMRAERKGIAKEKLQQAIEEGKKELVMTYAQQTSELSTDMLDESKKLLDAMGIPWVQAKCEGEAQGCYLVEQDDAYAVATQDYDALMFGGKRIVRNMSSSGRKRFIRGTWIEVKPEFLELEKVLSDLELNREQLILLGMLVGTDYNPGGIKGIGPKNALKIVKSEKTFENVMKKIKWEFDTSAEEIFDFFKNPVVEKDYEIEHKEINKDEIIKILTSHEFSEKRIEKNLEKLIDIKKEGSQSSLNAWLK